MCSLAWGLLAHPFPGARLLPRYRTAARPTRCGQEHHPGTRNDTGKTATLRLDPDLRYRSLRKRVRLLPGLFNLDTRFKTTDRVDARSVHEKLHPTSSV